MSTLRRTAIGCHIQQVQNAELSVAFGHCLLFSGSFFYVVHSCYCLYRSLWELLVLPGSWPRPSLPSPPSVMSCWQRERGRGMNIYTNTTNQGSHFARIQTLSPCHLLIRNVMISKKSPLWWILTLKVYLFNAWTLPQLFIFLFRDDIFLLHLLVKYINIHGADYKMLQCVFLKCYLTTLYYLQITKMS